jgi:FkbM family methyltransferase
LNEPKAIKHVLRDVQDARINRLISQFSQKNKDFFFIQVGSCDGKTGDPIYAFVNKFGWRGILVEPLKYLFEKLLTNYRDNKGLHFENIAIARETGQKKIYRVSSVTREGSVPWYERISSFDERHLLKQLEAIRNYVPNAKIVAEEVRCRPFSYLLDKYAVQEIDLLHIDTEGYDFEIIKMVPFDRVKPRMIFYESEHLSSSDRLSCEKVLGGIGYKLIRAKDTFAYLPQSQNRGKSAA